MKYLYKYPQAAFPYHDLEQTNKKRNRDEEEYEIADTGVFDDSRYFDVYTEYAKNDEEDICIRITVCNRAADNEPLTLLPTVMDAQPLVVLVWLKRSLIIELISNDTIGKLKITTAQLEAYYFYFQKQQPFYLQKMKQTQSVCIRYQIKVPFVKDAFHNAVLKNDFTLFDNEKKAAQNVLRCIPLHIEAGDLATIKLRLSKQPLEDPLNNEFDEVFVKRIQEADEFYSQLIKSKNEDLKNIQRQAFAGMLWSKQFYYFDIPSWLNGDKGQPPPPEQRKRGRDSEWMTLNNEDIISMPDKWEYPWYAAWDLAFHCIPLAHAGCTICKRPVSAFFKGMVYAP